MNIKNLLKKKERRFKKERVELSIDRYWRTAICFLFLIAVSSSFLGYYLFAQINSEPKLDVAEANSQFETVKKERIEKVLEYFSKRDAKSTVIVGSPAPVSDPSI
ncbi:MAG: hypothetical protein WCI76_01335 [bacterium]